MDKQIIDGIDVSGCICYKATGKYNTCGYDCEKNPNCYYKNWKRKEQECERLKQLNCIYSINVKQAKELKETLNHKRAYINNIENYNEQLNEQLDQLKAKNEELEKWKKEHLKDVEFIERHPVIDILNLMADNVLLEQRNEKLKGVIKKYEECNKYLVEENGKTYTRLEYKLLKTLTEIKEIAMGIMDDDLEESSAYCDAKRILQKISEVEDV